jgi:hypothetical protein
MFEATINQPQTQTLEADIPITKEIQTTNIPTFTLPIQQETAVQTIIQTTIPEHKKTS